MPTNSSGWFVYSCRALAEWSVSVLVGVILVALAQSAAAQTNYFTYTGLSSVGSSDGTGEAARFFNPISLALDAAGNVYVAEGPASRPVAGSGLTKYVKR